MENSRWLTILLIGLVLAGLVVGYFLLRNTFLPKPTPPIQLSQVSTASPPQATPSDFVLGENVGQGIPTPTPTPATFGTVSSPSTSTTRTTTPTTAVGQLTQRSKQDTNTLPATGFGVILMGISSAATVLLGWKLRKYPH